MIHRADVDVVDVEQDSAVSPLRNRGQELPFRHRRVPVGQIAGHVLDQDLAAQPILHLADPSGRKLQRFLRIWQRKQVVRVMTADRAPTKMVRNPSRLKPLDQASEFIQVAGSATDRCRPG